MRYHHSPHEGTSLQNSLSGTTVFSICVVQKYRILFAADEYSLQLMKYTDLTVPLLQTHMVGSVSGLIFFFFLNKFAHTK